MQKHTKVYHEYYNLIPGDYIGCEIPECNKQAVDLHHIQKRSSFGKKRKHLQDKIENIIALCREHHEDAEGKVISQEHIQEIHNRNL